MSICLNRKEYTKIDAFIAVTGNSETNILSCLLAKKMGVKRTIAEVENMEYINLAENTGIDTIINKKISLQPAGSSGIPQTRM